ncbi:MAG TPA: 30S ribosome-binding factor RbfA [Desulfobulbus sp.]|nr:30S ribosome-binding factor RbfA [Desulfobulbus sp.]
MEFDFTLPGLGRPRSSRPERVSEAIKNELSVLLLREVRDPRLARVTISRVVMSPDLKLARIFFLVPAGTSHRAAIKGMERARGFFRTHLARTLNLRYTPSLSFFYDSSNDEIERIDELLRQLEQEREGDAPGS